MHNAGQALHSTCNQYLGQEPPARQQCGHQTNQHVRPAEAAYEISEDQRWRYQRLNEREHDPVEYAKPEVPARVQGCLWREALSRALW
jgi:hypothetical protein